MYESDSKYEYPGTNVLINHFNIKDPQKLSLIEGAITLNRLFRLENSPIIGNFDLNHLLKIHKYIFLEIYPFAGQIRDENINKGGFRFAEFRYIESSANDLFKKLKSEKTLANLPKEEFAERAAFYMAEINVLHPFREGNGRTTREFIRTLCLKNGYNLEWEKVDKQLVFSATVKSIVDHKPLAEVINKCIKNDSPIPEYKKMFSKNINKGLER